ncbi:restriction endonuclease subunit S [Pseudomonas aeruginosa]|nr:restriction endonuclease subunit S [Pseudomonas aeruginosa]
MSWPIAKLGDIAQKVDYGLTASAVDNPGGPRFLRITDMQDDSVDWSAVPSCDCTSKEFEENKLEVGDILFARTGATTGKSYLIRALDRAAIFASYLIRVRPSENVDPIYLSHFFKSSNYWFQIAAMANGAAQPGVNSSKLRELEVPLPPLSEQKRIAAILDKADAIRRKRQQTIRLADDLLRSVFLDMFGDPLTNPKGWEVVELSELVDPHDRLNYGVVQPGENDPVGVPLVRSGDLSDITPDENELRRISADIDFKHRKSKLKGNEILIACVGTIGRLGWVGEDMVGWNIARAVTRIPIRDEVNREYIYRYLQSAVVQGYFERETRAVAQPTLNVGLIAKTPIALPPQELQGEFLERYRHIQAYKYRSFRALRVQESLMASLSQKAFSAKL